jgi:hypothetical protein
VTVIHLRAGGVSLVLDAQGGAGEPLAHGACVREGRHGRTGHDATLVLAVGALGFGVRKLGMAFRVATALSGHLGIEWDIASASAGEQAALAEVGLPMPVLRPEQALLPHLTSP